MPKIRKQLFHLLKKRRGSIVATLIAATLMGISSVALIGHISKVSDKTEEVTQKHSTSFDIHAGIMNNLRSLLVETKLDKNGTVQAQNRWGVCSLLKAPGKTHGVDLIEIQISSSLTGLAADSFSRKRWTHLFNPSEYELLTSDSHCQKLESSFQSSIFSRCFQYIGKASEKATPVYVIARIIPKKFPEFKKINLSKTETMDAKLVTFELQTIIGTDEAQQSPFKYNTMTWSNDIVECDVQVRSTWVNVQLTGTGTGRLSYNLVINNPYFAQNIEDCKEVEFGEIPSGVLMGGHILSDGSIAADHTQSKKLSCRKKIYRCPGETGLDTDYFDQINFQMHITNNYGGLLPFQSLNFTFLDDSDKEEDSVEDGKTSSVTVDVARVNDSFKGNTTLNPEITLQPGINIFSFSLTDAENNQGSLAALCSKVCSGNKYYPSASMEFSQSPSAKTTCDYSRDYTDDSYRIGCNVCHSKMCHKIGLGTFGPISDDGKLQGLVDEPLDGTLPECALKKTSISYDMPSVSSGSGNCVAMQVSGLNSFKNFKTNQYEFQSCSSSLPVLCFAYGHYLPAMSLTSTTTGPSVFTGSFDKAQEACYNMGKEIIDKNKLAEYFKRFWPNISANTNTSVISALTSFGLSSFDTNHFQYINNASRGIFIKPFYNISNISNRAKDGADSYLQKLLTGQSKIWVAMEKDGGDQVIGSIPQATTATSALSVFTRKEFPSRALILKDTNTISDSNTDTVLTYNMRYKGVYNVSRNGSRAVLCRKGAGDFILTTPTSLTLAPQACQSLGAQFIPPLSSMEWVKAMSLLNSNDEMYPFPNPGDFSGENYSRSISVAAPTAWVALKKAGSGSYVSDWRLSDIYFSDSGGSPISDSIFVTETVPAAGPDYMGIIDYQGKPIVLSKSEVSSINMSSYNKSCFKDNGNLQMTLKSSVAADQSCGSGQSVLNDSDLKFRSIKFMSEWIQENTTGEFIINDTLLQEAITQVKKIECKGGCTSALSGCSSSCSSNESSCRSGCTTTTYDPILKKNVTTTDPTCISNCSSARASCDSSCSNVKQNCDNTCSSTNDTSGHSYIWFK